MQPPPSSGLLRPLSNKQAWSVSTTGAPWGSAVQSKGPREWPRVLALPAPTSPLPSLCGWTSALYLPSGVDDSRPLDPWPTAFLFRACPRRPLSLLGAVLTGRGLGPWDGGGKGVLSGDTHPSPHLPQPYFRGELGDFVMSVLLQR